MYIDKKFLPNNPLNECMLGISLVGTIGTTYLFWSLVKRASSCWHCWIHFTRWNSLVKCALYLSLASNSVWIRMAAHTYGIAVNRFRNSSDDWNNWISNCTPDWKVKKAQASLCSFETVYSCERYIDTSLVIKQTNPVDHTWQCHSCVPQSMQIHSSYILYEASILYQSWEPCQRFQTSVKPVDPLN